MCIGWWMKASPNCGGSPPACTAPTATCATASRCRPCSRSIGGGRLRHLPGFGRVIGVDYGLRSPTKEDAALGAIKAIQTPAWKECQDDLMRYAETAGIPRDTSWHRLTRNRSTG